MVNLRGIQRKQLFQRPDFTQRKFCSIRIVEFCVKSRQTHTDFGGNDTLGHFLFPHFSFQDITVHTLTSIHLFKIILLYTHFSLCQDILIDFLKKVCYYQDTTERRVGYDDWG